MANIAWPWRNMEIGRIVMVAMERERQMRWSLNSWTSRHPGQKFKTRRAGENIIVVRRIS